MHGRPLPRVFSVSHVVDEQGNNVTFATKDAFVQGGGVIHSVNAVSVQVILAVVVSLIGRLLCYATSFQQHGCRNKSDLLLVHAPV
jgi:hypothetical protein